MINDAVFRKTVYDWVKQFVDVGDKKIIFETQAQHRPEKPYVTLHVIAGPIKRGSDDTEVLENGSTRVSGSRLMTVSINYLGANALGQMSRLQTSPDLPTVIEFFAARSVALVSDSGVRDLSRQVLDNRFETRAQMDVVFRVPSEMVDEPGFIDKAVLVNEIDDTETEINI